MAGSNKAVRIGVIAEERNDVDVIYQLTCKIIRENCFAFSCFVGHGCGKLRKKCKAWSRNLLERGCSHLVVVHDLDEEKENRLRKMLEAQINEIAFGEKVILIPAKELEAWLLCDPEALRAVFKMRRAPRVPRWPETISDPKKFLANVVRDNSNAQYLNTVHNRRIAEALSISNLDRCGSFSRYPKFLKAVFPGAGARVS